VTLSSWLICFLDFFKDPTYRCFTGIFSQPATSRKTPSDQTAQSFAMEVAPPITLRRLPQNRTRQLVLGIIPALMRNRLIDRLFKADAFQEFYYGYQACLAGQAGCCY